MFLRRVEILFSQHGMETVTRRSWLTQGDDFRTFLEDFVATSPRIEFPAGLNV
jgi:hypothetical protein